MTSSATIPHTSILTELAETTYQSSANRARLVSGISSGVGRIQTASGEIYHDHQETFKADLVNGLVSSDLLTRFVAEGGATCVTN